MNNKQILESVERIRILAEKMSKLAEEIKKDLKTPKGMLGRENGKVNWTANTSV